MLYTNGKSKYHFLEVYAIYRNIGIAIDIGNIDIEILMLN